ncbi:MAG: hypothetical protein U1F35_11725 [Steroidobacteraceae bacterium]
MATQRKAGLRISAASSSAVEGIHAPFAKGKNSENSFERQRVRRAMEATRFRESWMTAQMQTSAARSRGPWRMERCNIRPLSLPLSPLKSNGGNPACNAISSASNRATRPFPSLNG